MLFRSLVEVEEVPNVTSVKSKFKYIYVIKMFDGKVLKNVERDVFTTFREKDGTIIKDMWVARRDYAHVVDELRELF